MQERILIYFKTTLPKDRFIPGDRFIVPKLKQLIKGKKISGVEKVFINLCHSFDVLNVKYIINLPFDKILPSDHLVVLGGPNVLEGYNKPNKIVAGIALMTHPSEWPNLCEQYPIAKYLQHSKWAKNIYVPYYGTEVCDTWFAGIETEKWIPVQQKKTIDVLIYNKIRWEQDHYNEVLKNPIIKMLEEKGLSYQEIIYGQYKESDYHTLLMNCKTMIFLCEHESQGFACCEALSMDVPVLAWDQGFCLDPNRFKWNDPIMPATSVPFFDDRCGEKFVDIEEFKEKLPLFLSKFAQEKYSPRQYVLENLSLAKSGERMLDIIDLTYGKSSK
jgi:hypothetical protein